MHTPDTKIKKTSFVNRFPRLRRFFPWLGIVLVTFLAHVTYIQNGFTWIEHGDIEGGAAILAPGEFLQAFTTPLGGSGFFRPTSTLAYSIDRWLYGAWAPGYHITNIFLEILLVVITVFFVRRFFGLGEKESFLAALIAGIHPLSWLPVGAIAYRGEILMTIFTFLALSSYAAARKEKGFLAIIGFFVFSLAAFFSKETAVFFVIALVFLWEFLERKTLQKVWSRSDWFLLLSLCASGAMYLFLRMRALPEGWVLSQKPLPFLQAIGTRLEAFSLQIFHLISPFKPNLSDAIVPVSVVSPLSLFAVISIFVAFFFIWYLGPRSPIGRVLIFGGIALAPALNFVPIPRFTSPHYGYFAIVGIAVFVILLLQLIKEKAQVFYHGALLLFALWIGIMFTSTVRAGDRFRDDFTLFAPETLLDKNFIEGHYYLGTYFFERGNYTKAEKEYEAVAYPQNGVLAFVNRPPALINLARVKAELGKYDEADILLQLAAEESPRLSTFVLFNRAVFAARQENDKMVVDLLESLPGGWEKWDRPEPLHVLLQSLINLRRFDEANEVNAKLSGFLAR